MGSMQFEGHRESLRCDNRWYKEWTNIFKSVKLAVFDVQIEMEVWRSKLSKLLSLFLAVLFVCVCVYFFLYLFIFLLRPGFWGRHPLWDGEKVVCAFVFSLFHMVWIFELETIYLNIFKNNSIFSFLVEKNNIVLLPHWPLAKFGSFELDTIYL